MAMMPEEPREPRLKITEIFHSIQGESTLAGERFSFVRLTGCPLRCKYCDTTYAFTGGKWMSVTQIMKTIAPHRTRHVLLTGGEPLIQKDVLQLIDGLRGLGKQVSIETSGEVDVTGFAGKAKLVMDIKTPSSGEKAEICFRNLEKLQAGDEIKFVLCDRADYEWAKRVCEERRLTERFTTLFSVATENLPLQKLAEWIIEDKLNVRLQPQLHKWIWGKDSRGV